MAHMQIILIYLAVINIIGIIITARDKRAARRGTWRVPERTLFMLCILGGCPGVYAAMRLMRHKTLHKRFMWGIPAIFIVQIIIVGLIYFRLL